MLWISEEFEKLRTERETQEGRYRETGREEEGKKEGKKVAKKGGDRNSFSLKGNA